MRLPTNKKERMQVLVLIGMGVVVVLVVLVQFGLMPLLESRNKLREDREELRARLDKARRELRASTQVQAEFDDVTARLESIAADYLLKPILGSYLVGATETVEARAREAGFPLEDVQERGIQAIRLRAKETSTRYSAYSVQVNGQGSYDQIVSFLTAIEASNPFVCVTEIKVMGQADAPERHRVTFRIEWPIENESVPAAVSSEVGKGTP